MVLSIAIAALAYLCTREPGSQYVEEMLNRIVQVVNDAKTSGSATERLFTKEELKDYDGKTKSDIYLAIAGKVYDVTKGERFYAAGSHYGGFSGWRTFLQNIVATIAEGTVMFPAKCCTNARSGALPRALCNRHVSMHLVDPRPLPP